MPGLGPGVQPVSQVCALDRESNLQLFNVQSKTLTTEHTGQVFWYKLIMLGLGMQGILWPVDSGLWHAASWGMVGVNYSKFSNSHVYHIKKYVLAKRNTLS